MDEVQKIFLSSIAFLFFGTITLFMAIDLSKYNLKQFKEKIENKEIIIFIIFTKIFYWIAFLYLLAGFNKTW